MNEPETKTYRVISPKHAALMAISLKRIYDASFDEADVRTLVLGVRSFADSQSKQTATRQDAPNALRSGLAHLADIGHAIAHPELRDQGLIRKFVRKTVNQVERSHKKMSQHKVLAIDAKRKRIDIAMPPAIKPLSSKDLLTAFFIAMHECFPFEINRARFIEQRADIMLCLLSILHYSQMPDLDRGSSTPMDRDPRAAYLGLHSWQGKYHLYAGVMKSDMEAILAAHQGKQNRPSITIFPVFHGFKEVGCGPEMDIFNPRVVFAVRDASGELRLV